MKGLNKYGSAEELKKFETWLRIYGKGQMKQLSGRKVHFASPLPTHVDIPVKRTANSTEPKKSPENSLIIGGSKSSHPEPISLQSNVIHYPTITQATPISFPLFSPTEVQINTQKAPQQQSLQQQSLQHQNIKQDLKTQLITSYAIPDYLKDVEKKEEMTLMAALLYTISLFFKYDKEEKGKCFIFSF